MRAVIVRCPNCNANLQVQSTVVTANCQYCGTVSRIQPRTMMFQIPKQPVMPTQSGQMTNAERIQQLQQLAKMPIAVQRASMFLVFLPFILMAVIGGGVFFAVKKAGGLGGIGASTKYWAGNPPAVSDVDGDGVGDFIGITRYIQADDRAHFTAHSGKTGAELWESDSLGKYGDLSQMQFGAVGDTLFVATKDGKLIARNAKTKAAVKWEISFGEKIDAMCRNGNELVVETADDKWWIVDAAGKKREGKKLFRPDRHYTNDDAKHRFRAIAGEGGDVCFPLGWNHTTPPGILGMRAWRDVANIDNMRIDQLIKLPGGPSIAIGNKQPGTSVPQLARLGDPPPAPPPDPKHRHRHQDEKLLLPGAVWKIDVPSVDPLNSRMDSEHVTLSDKAVFALYQISNSKYRLAAFAIADGKRLWDREIEHRGHGSITPVCLTVTGDVVALTTWQSLTAYATSDGSERFVVGQSN